MTNHCSLYTLYKGMMYGQKNGSFCFTEHNLLDCAQHFWNIEYLWIKSWRQ